MLGNKVPCKRSPTILQQFWAIVKIALLRHTDVDTLWATFGENWATFYSDIWSH